MVFCILVKFHFQQYIVTKFLSEGSGVEKIAVRGTNGPRIFQVSKKNDKTNGSGINTENEKWNVQCQFQVKVLEVLFIYRH